MVTSTARDPKAYVDMLYEQAQALAPIKGTPEDKRGFNKAFAKTCVSGLVHPSELGVREKIKELPSGHERFCVISNANLRALHRATQKHIALATEALGEDVVQTVADEVQKQVGFSKLTLTHDPHWDQSSFSDDETLEKILKSKKLLAPCHTMDEPDRRLISLGAISADVAPDNRGVHFALSGLSRTEFERGAVRLSLWHADQQNVHTLAIGGNQMLPAWKMATLNHTLVNMMHLAKDGRKPTPADAAEKVKDYLVSVVQEINLPNEISLSGHQMYKDGVPEEIAPTRAARKPKKAEPDSVELGSEHLKPKPRKRGKTDE